MKRTQKIYDYYVDLANCSGIEIEFKQSGYRRVILNVLPFARGTGIMPEVEINLLKEKYILKDNKTEKDLIKLATVTSNGGSSPPSLEMGVQLVQV